MDELDIQSTKKVVKTSDPASRLNGSIVWFALGMIVTGALGTLGILAFLDQRIDDRIKGWSIYQDAKGRFLVGAGQGTAPETSFIVSSQGGSSSIELSPDNLPAHSHDVALSTSNEGKHSHSTRIDVGAWLRKIHVRINRIVYIAIYLGARQWYQFLNLFHR